MNKEILLCYLIIQLAVQYSLYRIVRKPIFGLTKAFYFIEKNINEKANTKNMMTALAVMMLCVNIGLSIVVKYFTQSGGMTGMTNLGASVILGFFMSFDCFLFKIKIQRQKNIEK